MGRVVRRLCPSAGASSGAKERAAADFFHALRDGALGEVAEDGAATLGIGRDPCGG